MFLITVATLLGVASASGSESGSAPLAASASFAPGTFAPQGPSQLRAANLNLLVGMRDLGDEFWEPNDEQFTVGMEFDTYRRDEWVGLDAGFHYGDDDTGGGFGQTTEMFVGVRKTFTVAGNLHPYVAAGATYIWATNGVSSPPNILAEQDSSFGLYGRGGIYWTFAEMVNIGVDVRFVAGTDIEAFGAEDADYVQFAGFAGWSM